MALSTTQSADKRLADARIGETFIVARVLPSPISEDWERWLEEIGFLPGERVQLMAKGFPGGDPLVVRVGQSTFALRQAEANCIHVVEESAA